MKLRKTFFILLLCGLLLSACGNAIETPANHKTPLAPQPTFPPPATDEQPPYPPAVTAALQALAGMLNIQPGEIGVAGYAAVDWGNACLDLGSADELCAAVITPGYRVILLAGEKFYVFHTDQSGDRVRQELAQANLPPAVVKARQALAAALNLASELLVGVVSFEEVEWPDSCLGVSSPDVLCAQVITPGYRVRLEVNGRQYEYHTSESGDRVAAVKLGPPSSDAQPALLVWQSPDEPCRRIEIGARAAAYGACDARMDTGPLQSNRLAELADRIAAYAPFQAETAAGTIAFQGRGDRPAAPAEQRALAEWARLVLEEMQSGKSNADLGLALAWRRQGGVAGFCEELLIYRDGSGSATDCKLNAAGARALRLDAAQLEQLYAWLDGFRAIEYSHTDAATADAMTVELQLRGTGDRDAGETGRQALIDFAVELFRKATE